METIEIKIFGKQECITDLLMNLFEIIDEIILEIILKKKPKFHNELMFDEFNRNHHVFKFKEKNHRFMKIEKRNCQ